MDLKPPPFLVSVGLWLLPRGCPGPGHVPSQLLRAEVLPGKLASPEVLMPYVEPQGEVEELAQADQAEVEAEQLPVSVKKSHVG